LRDGLLVPGTIEPSFWEREVARAVRLRAEDPESAARQTA
jgi:hypothetical protein